MKRLFFYVKLFPYFVSKSVKSRMSYRLDFFLGLFANALRQSLGFVFIWAVFRGIPEINGWNFYQMMFVYGMQAICAGLYEFLFAGVWSVERYVQTGELDRLLLRPVSTLFSIMVDDVTFHGLGAALFGLAICIVSLIRLKVILSVWLILFWVMSIITGTLIYFCLNMFAAVLAFKITKVSSVLMIVTNFSEFSKYPAAIYSNGLQILLSFVLPFAFTSYYPAAFILGIGVNPVFWAGPFVAAAVCLGLTTLFWHWGLKGYQSAGG